MPTQQAINQTTKQTDQPGKHWYAFHIYRNYRQKFIETLKDEAQTYYLAEQVTRTILPDYTIDVTRKLLFPTIIFVHCEPAYVEAIRRNPAAQVSPYLKPGTKEPAIISDKEMETFQFVLDTGCEQLDVIDEKLAKGDRVRVRDGVFKGTEGVIIRLKGNRRFVVSINGIAAVATSYIPQRYLEKLEP